MKKLIFLMFYLLATHAISFGSDNKDGFNTSDRSPTSSEVAQAIGDILSSAQREPALKDRTEIATFLNELTTASRYALRGELPEVKNHLFNARMLAVINDYPPLYSGKKLFLIEEMIDKALQGKNPFAVKPKPPMPKFDFDY